MARRHRLSITMARTTVHIGMVITGTLMGTTTIIPKGTPTARPITDRI